MKAVRDASIRVKLLGGFGAVIGLLVVGVVVSALAANSMSAATHDVTLRAEPDMIAGDDLRFAVAEMDGAQNQYLLDAGASRSGFNAAAAGVARAMTGLRAAAAGQPAQETLAHDAQAALTGYLADDAKVYALVRAGDVRRAIKRANGTASGAFIGGLLGAAQRFVTNARAERTRFVAQFESAKSSALRTQLMIAAISVLIAIGVALLLTRSIKRGVDVVLDRMRSLQERCVTYVREGVVALADGDLTRRYEPVTAAIPDPAGDEIGQVGHAVNAIRDAIIETIAAYNQSADRLSEIIGQVAQTAGTVNTSSQEMAATSEEAGRASGEIAHAVSDVAGGAERQVQMIENARHAAEEVARAVTESAEQAQRTAEVAVQAREVAVEGVTAAEQANLVMRSVQESSEQVTTAIGELASKSDQIGQIVKTITGIAEQTNLLALNAAIEAARAGEQGKGFAVVAEEVRKLAEESQHATQEISQLVAAIQAETSHAVAVVRDGAERTQEGATVVEHTRAAFEQIDGAVQDMSDRIEQIAAAAQQVAAGAQSMQDSISEVAAVAEESSASTEEVSASTEETSASAEQIAASAQELSGSAQGLSQLVARFKTSTS